MCGSQLIVTSKTPTQTGQTRPTNRSNRLDAEMLRDLKPQTREGPVETLRSRIVLESADHPECCRDEQIIAKGLEKLGFEKKGKKKIKVVVVFVLIDWISQSAVTIYIYRVGRTYPARNPIYRSKSVKILFCTRTPHGLVRSVYPA